MISGEQNSSVTYIVKKDIDEHSIIYRNSEEIATIHQNPDMTYNMTSKNGEQWILSPKVHGEIRPFSMTVKKIEIKDDKTIFSEVLIIHSHLFKHKNKFYMLNIAPEGIPLRETLKGPKYICRLKKSPVSNIEEIDDFVKSKLRWLRGIPVAEVDHPGPDRHKIKLSNELEDIALPLVASSHLMFALF